MAQFRLRKFQWDDLPAIAAVENASVVHDQLPEEVSVESIHHLWHNPYSNPESQCLIAVDEKNRLIGYSSFENPILPYRSFTKLAVHPDFRTPELLETLIQTIDAQFLKTVSDQIPDNQPIYILRRFHQQQAAFAQICEQLGYMMERNFYKMSRSLADYQTPELQTSTPFKIRFLDIERDLPAVHQVVEEAFKDHWEHTPLDFETWQYRYIQRPIFDASVCLVALQEGRIVGATISRQYSETEPDFAWLSQLAVKREYRKQGLGSALLHTTLKAYKDKGFQRAGLGVDAENTTNALSLYKRAGLQIDSVMNEYRKFLRPIP